MAAVVILGVIALVAAIVAGVTWHRGADERQSVQHHQHTLETLRHVADRQQSTWPANGRGGATPKERTTTSAAPGGRAPGSERGGSSGHSDNGAARSKRAAPARRDAPASKPERDPGSVAGASPSSPSSSSSHGAAAASPSAKVHTPRRETIVFADDAADAPTPRPTTVSSSAARRIGIRLPGAAERSRRHGHARVKRTRIVAGATVVVVGVAVGSVVAAERSHSPPHPTARPVTAVGRGRATTTSTTTVASGDLTPTAPTAHGATYAAPSTSYTVAIGASAQCWVMATEAATGNVVWTGTIAAGASHSLSVSGALIVRLGAPSDANVTMDGRLVQLPSGFRSPFDLTFQVAS